MLAAIGGILLFFWIIGLTFHVMGSFIHLLFLAGIVLLLVHFIRPRTRV